MVKRVPGRKIAIDAGERFYVGSPCLRNHSGKRYTNGGACVECNRMFSPKRGELYRQTEAYKEYQKQYQAKYKADPKNRERLDKIQAKYQIKKFYNGDVDAYNEARIKREERTAEIRAHEAEVAMRRTLREQRYK